MSGAKGSELGLGFLVRRSSSRLRLGGTPLPRARARVLTVPVEEAKKRRGGGVLSLVVEWWLPWSLRLGFTVCHALERSDSAIYRC